MTHVSAVEGLGTLGATETGRTLVRATVGESTRVGLVDGLARVNLEGRHGTVTADSGLLVVGGDNEQREALGASVELNRKGLASHPV